MKNIRKRLRSPLATTLLFALAIVLLLGGTVGAARAALNVESQYFSAGVELYDIGVTLNENKTPVSKRDYVKNSDYVWDENIGALLSTLVPENDTFHMGEEYKWALSVTNSGSIDEYVRASVYRYWIDKNGKKLLDLDPSLIAIDFSSGGNGWVLDKSSSTTERTVLYYTKLLPVGKTTPAFTSKLKVVDEIPYKVHQTQKGNVITTTYDYDGVSFQVEVIVDGVQTHNAADAIRSAWGREVRMSGSSYTLVK